MIVVRAAIPVDADAVTDLLVAFGYQHGALSHVASRLAAEDAGPHVLVAERDGKLVGVASLSVSIVLERAAPQARISVLVVDESERRRGTGRALVDALEVEARDLGCSRIELTSSYVLPIAHEFWRGAGYTETGLRFVKSLADEPPWNPPSQPS